ncbi:MAG: YdeI/OmpD-associated family protein [Ekhidna sp.]
MNPLTLKTTILKFESELWSYYVPIPKKIGNSFIDGDNRRVKCTINSGEPIYSALMHKGDVYSIYMKKEFLKKNKLSEGDEVRVTLEKDNTEYGMPVPESLQVLMDQDDEGVKFFKQLTMGKQRSLIHIVGKVKNVDSQLAKGLAIMHHLKEAKGELAFKRLNVLIKEYNNRR